ncbi:MAG: hypothetical protein GY870_02450 [archaeon]|nr:hypothetical protein [archaeon]
MFFSKTIISKALQIPLFIIILFSNDTNIGMADFAIEDMVNKIGKII